MRKIEKNSGPRTTCFLVVWRLPLLILSLKGAAKSKVCKKSPKSCVPLFFSRKAAGTHDSGSRKCRYARFWLEKNSSSIVRTTIFIEPDSCVPLFFSSRIRAYPHFFEHVDGKNAEIDDFPTISGTWTSKIVPGFFIMVFCYIFTVNFQFSGPAVVPPTKGVEKSIFSRNLPLGWNCCINPAYLSFPRKNAGTHDSGSRKKRYAQFRLEKNSTRIVRTTIFVMFRRA